jgi:hypothetical protein
VGKNIVDVVFHDSHGLVIDVILDDGTKVAVATYDDGRQHDVDEFYVGLNDEEL